MIKKDAFMFRNFFTLQEKVIAVVEQVLINVNLKLRKSEPYPSWAFEKLLKLKNAHKNASLPSAFGKSIGLKK